MARLRLSSFRHCSNLLETVWKQLPAIVLAMGKKKFKAFLDDFLEPLFDALACGHRLVCVSALIRH